MPRQLEFHDSELVNVAHDGGDAVLSLRGYVHQWDVVDGQWRGWGWIMPVRITISGATRASTSARGHIADGALTVGATYYHSMIPLPLDGREVALQLSIADSVLVIRGGAVLVDVSAADQGRRVDALPDSWKPPKA